MNTKKAKTVQDFITRVKESYGIFSDPDATDQIIQQGIEISLEIIRRAREKKAILDGN